MVVSFVGAICDSYNCVQDRSVSSKASSSCGRFLIRDLSVRVWRAAPSIRLAWRHIARVVRLLDEELSGGAVPGSAATALRDLLTRSVGSQ